MAATPHPAQPLIRLAVIGAGVGAAFLGNQLLERGWEAIFKEDAPTDKVAKRGAKDTKAERKQAKKDGATPTELAEIHDPMDDLPVWKILLWTVLSGVAIQGIKLLAERGVQKGAERLIDRRPGSNRG
ncbi:DUF4235 domain-containing protein [Brachybacterium sp. AOP25-B2-12]|uniref:DUF4235 domain-containing protein n=1 Tax=Brachybacterium sp. AOP25-B2-12 TaxID=3457710 RepID=UPI004034D2A9